jgi:hypothetical protein
MNFIEVVKLANSFNMNLYKNKSETKFRLYENNDRLEYTDFATLEEVYNYLIKKNEYFNRSCNPCSNKE